VRSLVEPESALYFQPRQLVRMIPWLVRFATHCNERDHATGRIALGELAEQSVSLLEGMAADGVPIELNRLPLLLASSDPPSARAFLDRLAPVARLGFTIPDRPLEQQELLALEPALTDGAITGFVIEPHCVVNPSAVVTSLRDRLVELGVEIAEGVEVQDIEIEGGRVTTLRTSDGRHACQEVVLAAGSWLQALGRRFGLRLPIEAGKGYSFEVRPRQMPRHALLLLDPHVGCSPFGDRIRIGGTMEFSGVNARIDRRRVDAIVRGAERMLGPLGDRDPDSLWSGLRPIAPDGLPIIDRHPRLSNVFIGGAYSMLGMTLAPSAGHALASFILTGDRPAVLEPFQATRFRGL
jgi:D-amino-acid dehydrogenase